MIDQAHREAIELTDHLLTFMARAVNGGRATLRAFGMSTPELRARFAALLANAREN